MICKKIKPLFTGGFLLAKKVLKIYNVFGGKMKQFLEIGKIVNTHGIKGELRLQPWCDGVDFIKQFKTLYLDENGTAAVVLSGVRPHKNMAVIRLAGINSIDEAQKLKNRILYCNRDDAEIAEDANYIQDIIGCRVNDAQTGAEYGTVADVLNYGASDILEIDTAEKKEYVPIIDDIVKNIDCKAGIIEIIPMKGLFDED